MNNELQSRTDISLLFPSGNSSDGLYGSDGISADTAEQLELYTLIDLSSLEIGAFFTEDPAVIRYRQATFADICSIEGLCEVLRRMLPFLTDIRELRRISGGSDSIGDSYLYSITEIEIYTSLMELLHSELLPLADKFKSPAFIAFAERIRLLTESDYYKNLTEHLAALASRVRDIRSITVGVNLDRRLMPESSGVLSVNSDKFKSGEFFERVKRLDFKKDDMTFMADLLPYTKDQSENQQIALTNAVNNAISDVFKSSVKSWKKAVQYYVLDNTDFLLKMVPEIEFLTEGEKLVSRLRERGVTLCTPEILEDGSNRFSAKRLCNPVIALKTEGELVPNDIAFDESAMIFVITGPNRGGKSVLTCALGHAFAMAQMGLPVCAEECTLSVTDRILTHFPAGSEDTVEKGRLGEECARLDAMFDVVTDKSLVLLDESLSSTGSYEGAYIAAEVLRGFSMAGCRGIFSTHLHDLAASVESINKECVAQGGVRIDNMVAEVIDGERSFRIVRKTPDGKSYAQDIAEKYGLSAEKIMTKLEKNKNSKK
ncbi:MAG: hypothetical protein E7647_08450 [Ruminococcaceae bacterium]|nr:hypothetical protein [Oscillospiraceae bacterium]